MIKLTVPSGQDGADLSACILDMLPSLKASQVKKLVRSGDVRINGIRMKRDTPVGEGDQIDLYLKDEYEAYIPEIDVIYEDENMIIANKQAGLSCLSDKDDGKPTLYSLAVKYMQKTGEYCIDTLTVPYICHRLDHYTGGLVMIAKNQQYFELISQAIRQRGIRKFYECIVVGNPRPSEAELRAYLIKDSIASKVKITDSPSVKAEPILTRYKVLDTNREVSLLEVELVTGKTHQIRAHLAHIGHPILGDDKYGDRKANKKYGVKHQALWAVRIRFETGTNNLLSYLDGQELEADEVLLPEIEF